GTPNERSIGKISVLELEAGDVVRITSPCGGGFGNPLERDLGDISDEIKSGMLSRERAEEVYAVAFGADGDIDVTETAARRRVKVNDTPAEFNFCSERKRHDSVWPLEIRRELASLALTHEQRIRSQLVGNI